jgi:hypothetical protein
VEAHDKRYWNYRLLSQNEMYYWQDKHSGYVLK